MENCQQIGKTCAISVCTKYIWYFLPFLAILYSSDCFPSFPYEIEYFACPWNAHIEFCIFMKCPIWICIHLLLSIWNMFFRTHVIFVQFVQQEAVRKLIGTNNVQYSYRFWPKSCTKIDCYEIVQNRFCTKINCYEKYMFYYSIRNLFCMLCIPCSVNILPHTLYVNVCSKKIGK